MKQLIVGSRSIESFDLSEYVPCETDMIISGGARGIDRVAERYADDHKISKLIMYPRYDLYGRTAPLIRNREMVDLADAVLVIWDGKSRGAMHTSEYARKKNKSLTVILSDLIK